MYPGNKVMGITSQLQIQMARRQSHCNQQSTIRNKERLPTDRQPDNIDLLSVIRDLNKELRCPLKAQWIKSHQDTSTTYDKLSIDAKLNVDADELATKAHKRPRSRPLWSTAHIPVTQVSISRINRVRYYGNLDANLRFHINCGQQYLRNYLQTTNALLPLMISRRHWNFVHVAKLLTKTTTISTMQSQPQARSRLIPTR